MISHIKFISLPVRNQDLALAFYTEKLGFKVVSGDQAKKWLVHEGEKIRLTPSGRLFANEVVSEFLLG